MDNKRGKKLFEIPYDTWKNVCEMYFSLNVGSQRFCLQWFPFTKLTTADKIIISGKDFYNTYIQTASFMLFPPAMHQSENYLQKSDGSFRDSSLISPVLFLFLQLIGYEINKHYSSNRPSDISVYYAGNFDHFRPKYKQDYDNFFKKLNASIDKYQYFIKTDIANFFASISIDKLITQIDRVCNSDTVVFSQPQLLFFKELLRYCGNGRFPLIENSMATSFLATVVYLDEVDKDLHEYISTNVEEFSSFQIVRYVDDMYILISSDKPIEHLHEAYNEIRYKYSSILKNYGMALNTKKCCLRESKEINRELKKSLYDESFNGQKHNIEELFSKSLFSFLSHLSNELLLDNINIERYNELIDDHFSSDDIEFTASEVFNYFVYENEKELKSKPVVKKIIQLVERNISFISLDPKRLTVMIMKTQNDRAIKGFLNQLFKRHRSNKWNTHDTTIAISYLIQSKFRHIDLLNILSIRHPDLYSYYMNHCKCSTIGSFKSAKRKRLASLIELDRKAHYLYFMYLCELKKENYMEAFAYYKNYFDRVTADLEFEHGKKNSTDKKPSYNAFYKEKSLIKFYSEIEDSERIIKKAQRLRNANPLAHASAELLDSNNTSIDLRETIKDLSKLIYSYVDNLKEQD